MFEWMSLQYLKLIANFRILLENPTQCSTVDLLRLFTLTLFFVFLVKLVAHSFTLYRLKRRFPRYGQDSYPRLFRVYRLAAEKVQLRRTPWLFQFGNAKPLVFTAGTLRPAIFLAPKLVAELPQDELESVLVHELTHIKRRDNLLIWLLELLFAAIPVLMIQVFAVGFIFSVQNSVKAICGALVLLMVFKGFLMKRILFYRELSCDDKTVEAIHDPLTLAGALVNVWRISQALPKYRWRMGFAFAQPHRIERRAKRLVDYRRPWLKFFVGKAARVTAIVLLTLVGTFLLHFHSTHSQLNLSYCHDGFFFCSNRAPLFLHLSPKMTKCLTPPHTQTDFRETGPIRDVVRV